MPKRRSTKKPIEVGDTSRFKYQDQEKVLCLYRSLLYEAKCLKRRLEDDEPKYFVHYCGWNKNWDEWLTESQILKFNDNNLRILKELKDIQKRDNDESKSKASKNDDSESESSAQIEEVVSENIPVSENLCVPTSSRASDRTSVHSSSTPVCSTTCSSATHPFDANQAAIPKNVTNDASTFETLCASLCLAAPASSASTSPTVSTASSAPSRQRKRKVGAAQQPKKITKYVPTEELPLLTNKNIRINITKQMRKWLIDDYDTITRLKRLYTLPAKINVDKILKKFIKYKKKRDNIDKEAELRIIFIIKIIRVYFNRLLEKMLLYNFERSQYEMYNQSQARPASQIYGGIYLLRLFACMNSMLTKKDKFFKVKNEMRLMVPQIEELLRFLATKPKTMYSLANYEVASQVEVEDQ
ncbi:MORF4L1 [Cordylochernes scorpioides]|uniref:MORF4L1 n=1 Tax=Cordylochernes scorpioides TaxID=51811 RepID=A0ABY6LUY0_9ARAC|nr:MORF4L1 [Cordylochernes scorpioides]